MPSRNCCTSIFNYTPGYVREELEEQPLVENPELRERKKQRAGLVSELNRLKIELADHLLEPPAKKRGTPSRSQRSEEHTSELQSRENLVCRLLLEKKK